MCAITYAPVTVAWIRQKHIARAEGVFAVVADEPPRAVLDRPDNVIVVKMIRERLRHPPRTDTLQAAAPHRTRRYRVILTALAPRSLLVTL